MMQELKDLLNKGGEKVFTRYAVEIGDTLWTALYSRVNETYSIEGVYEDEAQKFAILKADDKYYRLDFSISESEEIVFAEEVVEVEEYTPDAEPQFDADAVASFVENYKKEDKKGEEDNDNSEEKEEKEVCEKCGKPKDECTCHDEEEEDKKKQYTLEEIPEYVELSTQYSALEENYNNLLATVEGLNNQIAELTTFKVAAERKDKQEMIDSFYMLSDEDKSDVIANIDTYSLDDIEAKLSIICVRNKVNFNLDDNGTEDKGPTTFNLDGGMSGDEDTPAWVKALRSVAKNM